MPIWMDVDTAVTVPVNKVPIVSSADGRTIDQSIAWNEAGIEIWWHFFTTAGAAIGGPITPTSAGLHPWTHGDTGMYVIGIPASGGDMDNDTEGFGWISGTADGLLPFAGPVIGFRSATLNNLLVDSDDLYELLRRTSRRGRY